MVLLLKYYLEIWKIFLDNTSRSFYSYKFYEEVYQKFNGYGIKHFLLCCFLASAIDTVWIFGHFEKFAAYLKYHNPTSYSASLEAVFNQLPELKYDGKSISSELIGDEVFYIQSPSNQHKNLVAIDLSGKDQANKFAKLIVKPKSLTLHLQDSVQIEYSKLNLYPFTIDGAGLRKILTEYVSSFESQFLYTIFPGMLLFNIYNFTLQNIFFIAFAVIVIKISFKTSGKSVMRASLFALSGVLLLKSAVRCFIQTAGFVDYYSMITIFLASKAVFHTEKKSQY
jgi:hypothetical protein